MATRTFLMTRAEAGRTVAKVLCAALGQPWWAIRHLLKRQQVRLGGKIVHQPSQRVRAGQRLEILFSDRSAVGPRDSKRRARHKREGVRPASSPPGISLTIRHADEQVVVVDKPAGLTTVRHAGDMAEAGERARRFLPPTLVDLLPPLLGRSAGGKGRFLRAVHRLDRDTSGLVVLARTPNAERHLGLQFRAHTIERKYLAIVRGRAKSERLESFLVRDRGDGRRGSSSTPGIGQRAVTHVRVLEELGNYTLVECRLETGRTHQVRIHLGERGTPLCGERVYDRPVHGAPLPDGSGFRRPALHAAGLAFDHPATGKRTKWTSPLPRDMAKLLARLKRQAGAAKNKTREQR
jgi:23S rRNA pseudouridine1911/1915/1917 synthase